MPMEDVLFGIGDETDMALPANGGGDVDRLSGNAGDIAPTGMLTDPDNMGTPAATAGGRVGGDIAGAATGTGAT